eukprot:1159621-Pelagomonas_calceolata.AAC.19
MGVASNTTQRLELGFEQVMAKGHTLYQTCVTIIAPFSLAWSAGVEVTLIDANHCPGAVIFLFRLPNGKRWAFCYAKVGADTEKHLPSSAHASHRQHTRYIHCGDMRYSAAYLEDPLFQQFRGADAVFLDTTYCKERYTFPPQVCLDSTVNAHESCIQLVLLADITAKCLLQPTYPCYSVRQRAQANPQHNMAAKEVMWSLTVIMLICSKHQCERSIAAVLYV